MMGWLKKQLEFLMKVVCAVEVVAGDVGGTGGGLMWV